LKGLSCLRVSHCVRFQISLLLLTLHSQLSWLVKQQILRPPSPPNGLGSAGHECFRLFVSKNGRRDPRFWNWRSLNDLRKIDSKLESISRPHLLDKNVRILFEIYLGFLTLLSSIRCEGRLKAFYFLNLKTRREKRSQTRSQLERFECLSCPINGDTLNFDNFLPIRDVCSFCVV